MLITAMSQQGGVIDHKKREVYPDQDTDHQIIYYPQF